MATKYWVRDPDAHHLDPVRKSTAGPLDRDTAFALAAAFAKGSPGSIVSITSGSSLGVTHAIVARIWFEKPDDFVIEYPGRPGRRRRR